MSCDLCWEFFSKRKQLAELKKENENMRNLVREALSQVEDTHQLLREYTQRIDSFFDSIENFSGKDDL